MFVGVVSFGHKNAHWLRLVIDQYRDFPWTSQIVVVSNIPRDLGPDVEVLVRTPPDNPKYFPFFLRELLCERANNFDMFIATEDDVGVSSRNIYSFDAMSALLPPTVVPGFLRYELLPDGQRMIHDMHAQFGWVPGSVRRIGDSVFAQYENVHSALYMLTRDQLQQAVQSGRMHDMHSPTRWYGPLEAATTHLYEHCGLTKVFPVSHAEDFLVHHLPNTYAGKIGVSDDVFFRYVRAVSDETDGAPSGRLAPPTCALSNPWFDKRHFEPARGDLVEFAGAPKNILWIGSTEGSAELTLSAQGHNVTCVALDGIHAKALRLAGLEALSGSLEEAIAQLDERLHDLIVIPEMLERFSEPPEVLAALARKLAPHGRILVTSPNLARWRGVAEHGTPFRQRLPIGRGVHFKTHRIHPIDARRLRLWFRAAGLRCSVQHVGVGLRLLRRLTAGTLDHRLAPKVVAVGTMR